MQPHNSRGALIQPFEKVLAAEYGYYLVYSERSANQPNVSAFRSWLLHETKAGEPP
ncbi:hypothetical protein J7355_16335 [Endozoicomonas sp. G2_2]|nr:hypothetical protein [Endozoicomonas sp. G2_2]